MGVKVYISGISGNKEVKKRQQRVLMILESRNIDFSVVDIAEPGRESDKDFMQEKSTSLGATVSDTNPRHALPPQLFNDEEYCGDYDQFDLANEIDEIEKFLKLTPNVDNQVSNSEITAASNGVSFTDSTDTAQEEISSKLESAVSESTVTASTVTGATEDSHDSAAEDEEN